MSKVFILALSLISFCALSQASDTTKSLNLNTEVTVASRNIWRGLSYGSAPTIQGTLSLMSENFEVGTYGTTTLNGTKHGYGTWVELFGTLKFKKFSFTVDDYFFFNEDDSLNNYFEWGKARTQHFIEGRLKFDSDKLDITSGYAFYKNDNTHGIYVEAEYSPFQNFSFLFGGLTSASYLSFYNAGGITTLGVSGKRQIGKTLPLVLKTSLIFNPSYDKSVHAPGVGTNPVYVVIYLTL